MNVILRFGGFYGSNHDQYVCDMVDNYFDINNGGEYPDGEINYRIIYEEYSKELCREFGDILGVTLNFGKLFSPKYYNFETDNIELEVSEYDGETIVNMVDLKDIEELAREYTTPRDGYIPYYTYDEVMNEYPEFLVEFALELLYSHFEDEIMKRMYNSDFIYGLDFIDN